MAAACSSSIAENHLVTNTEKMKLVRAWNIYSIHCYDLSSIFTICLQYVISFAFYTLIHLYQLVMALKAYPPAVDKYTSKK